MKNINFQDKRVLLRADLNVPLKGGIVRDDHRLQALLPTIDFIRKHGGKVILMTHVGRPKKPTPALSTKNLISWFENRSYPIDFEPDLTRAQEKSYENPENILLLENLRFFPGEQSDDIDFAKKLATLGDLYVNDAFGVLHRTDSSITLLPQQFAPENRTFGLIVEKELQELKKIKEHPEHPFVVILGGSKISTKLPLLRAFVGVADTILLCPAIVFTFLKALGKPVGKSLVDNTLLQAARDILKQAQQKNTKIIFPVDYQIAEKSFDGPLSLIDTTEIPDNAVGISIGPKTQQLFADEIKKAKTVFFNGAVGNPDRRETLDGMHTLLSSMADSDAFTVIGGGDSVGIVRAFDLEDQLSFCSTGGGATLAYLAGKKLPGLKVF